MDAFSEADLAHCRCLCDCRVCNRLRSYDDARRGYAMLQYHALLVAQPRAQPGMLRDDAVNARTLRTTGFGA